MSTSMTAMSGSVAARKTTVAGGIKPLVRARPASLARTVCRAETKPQDGRTSPTMPRPSGWSPQGNSGPSPPKYEENPLDSSRPFRRTIFTLNDWKRHRTMARYMRHLKSMPRSGIVAALLPGMLWYTADAALIGTWATLKADGLLPDIIPAVPDVGATPFSLTAFALSLLLVFRTNSSYGRWDEARKMWGLQVNRSRDLARQAVTYMDPVLAKEVVQWNKAFNAAYMCHMRDDREFEEELMKIGLTAQETRMVLQAGHRPLFCMQVLSDIIALDKNLCPRIRQQMDQNLTQFEDNIGGSERILRTPVPLFYSHHLSRFLTIWLAFLPLGLWKTMGWMSVPGMALISFFLLGIDEIGIQIEEPFGILPLEGITNTIANNIDELARSQAQVSSIYEAQFSTLAREMKEKKTLIKEHTVA